MIAILDASAALETVLGGKRRDVFAQQVERADWVIAPHLFLAEVSNALWKYHRFHGVVLAKCEEALDRAVSLIDHFAEDRDLYREAFAQGCLAERPVYDMFYLVLARRNNGVLLTADKQLVSLGNRYSVRVFSGPD